MKTLADFHNIHAGSTIVVCGCGESLNELTEPQRFITIGVNDVGRKFQPNYLVVVNPRDQFSGDRFTFVENSEAEYLFTQLDLGLARENLVPFNLGTNGGTDLSDLNVLHYTQNSPYVALCLAVHMDDRDRRRKIRGHLRVNVGGVVRRNRSPDDLHVLLRHRPRSIAQAQESA